MWKVWLLAGWAPLSRSTDLLRGADLGQDFLRLSRLPLSVVQAFACLTEVHFAQTRLGFLDASDREVQPLTHFSQSLQLRIFAR